MRDIFLKLRTSWRILNQAAKAIFLKLRPSRRLLKQAAKAVFMTLRNDVDLCRMVMRSDLLRCLSVLLLL